MTPVTPTQHSSLVGGSTANRRRAKDITAAEVRVLLNYDPHTGALTWKERSVDQFNGDEKTAEVSARKWNTRHAGRPAINTLSNGYLTGHINYTQVYAHRIAWTHYHGRPIGPGLYLDHVNGDRTDNRIGNLRVVTPQQSAFNLPSRSKRHGIKGVKYDSRRGHWYARIRIDGQDISLGRFPDAAAAAEAYKKAAEKYQGEHAYHISREGDGA